MPVPNRNRVPLDKAPSGKLTKVSTYPTRDGNVCRDYYGDHKQDGIVLYTSVKTPGGTIWYYAKPYSAAAR